MVEPVLSGAEEPRSSHRLEIGIALLIQDLAPVLIALWARFVMKEPCDGGSGSAIVLAGILLAQTAR